MCDQTRALQHRHGDCSSTGSPVHHFQHWHDDRPEQSSEFDLIKWKWSHIVKNRSPTFRQLLTISLRRLVVSSCNFCFVYYMLYWKPLPTKVDGRSFIWSWLVIVRGLDCCLEMLWSATKCWSAEDWLPTIRKTRRTLIHYMSRAIICMNIYSSGADALLWLSVVICWRPVVDAFWSARNLRFNVKNILPTKLVGRGFLLLLNRLPTIGMQWNSTRQPYIWPHMFDVFKRLPSALRIYAATNRQPADNRSVNKFWIGC